MPDIIRNFDLGTYKIFLFLGTYIVLDIIFIFLFRNIVPDMFADHIGNLSVELVLAAAEVNILI